MKRKQKVFRKLFFPVFLNGFLRGRQTAILLHFLLKTHEKWIFIKRERHDLRTTLDFPTLNLFKNSIRKQIENIHFLGSIGHDF